jgi:SNF2 family DNA or RNA helicase
VSAAALQMPSGPPVARTRHPLWPHQADAFRRARAYRSFLLAIGMGGGKSAIAIALAEDDLADKREQHPGHPFRVLVVAPKSVVGVWPNQIHEHATSNWATWAGQVHGARGPLKNPSVPRRAEALINADKNAALLRQPFMAVVNFEAAHAGDMGRLTFGTPWDLLVIDESHRIKAPGGKASKHIARIAEKVRARGGRILALTGTPMPHSPLDLWAQYRALDGGRRLGTSYQRFCHTYGAGEQIYTAGGVQRTVFRDLDPDRLDQFTQLVAPLMHQVTEADLDTRLGLPPQIDTYRTCDLDPSTRKAYDSLEKDLIADVGEGVVTAANAMVLVLRLAQATSGFGRDADTGRELALAETPEKARLLADVLEDLPAREPVIVFCRFHHDLDAVAKVAAQQGRRYAELSGRRRDGLTADSTMTPDADLVGVQLQSGGVGIDLTRARYGIYFSLDFALADYLQSRKRLHRPGQTRPVTYVHLLAEDTIDRAVYGALKRRQEVVGAVLAHLQKGTTS